MQELPEEATYNPEEDAPAEFLEGEFPGHISFLDKRWIEPSKSYVYDYKVKIAQEAHTIMGKNTEDKQVPGTNMVHKDIKFGNAISVWLTPEPGEKERWKNKKYIDFHQDILGIKFPTKKVNKVDVVQIQEVDAEDVVGIPVIIRIGREWNKDKDKYWMKAIGIKPWPEGKHKNEKEMEEDDLPF